tara:strand:+ start:482 stop:733 length:252 start_codon:yes stop_codon:yes gene_type:complete
MTSHYKDIADWEVAELKEYITILMEYADEELHYLGEICTAMRPDADVVMMKLLKGEATLKKICERVGVKIMDNRFKGGNFPED